MSETKLGHMEFGWGAAKIHEQAPSAPLVPPSLGTSDMSVKQQIRNLEAAAREARMWAGEAVARAAHYAADDNVDDFSREMAEAARLALVSASRTKEARALLEAQS